MNQTSIFDAPIIRNQDDIVECIEMLDNGDDNMHIDTLFDGVNDKESRVTYRITADVKHKSKRAILQDGFDIIKSRMESSQKAVPILVNGRESLPASVVATDSLEWLDQLIERWMGAKRDGLNIVWNIDNYKYIYDFYNGRLFREKA